MVKQKSEPSDYPRLAVDTSDNRVARLAKLDNRAEPAAQLAQGSRDLEFIVEQKRREIFERARRQSECPIARWNENGGSLGP
jgi:hypothetical protein